MGSPPDEPCRNSDETQHQVTLTRGFYMMTTEMTRQMWADLKAVQSTLPHDPSYSSYSPTMEHPVQQTTWYEAVLFANLMSVQDSYTPCYYKDTAFTIHVDATNYTSGSFYCNFNANGYRLPTEAEWEYACRAGTTGAFSCNEPNYTIDTCGTPHCVSGEFPVLEKYCTFCANDPGLTVVVGSKLPNPAGLYDMHGNVMEWCWDKFRLYHTNSKTDPTGAPSGISRVYRGGKYSYLALCCRSAYRDKGYPEVRRATLGFRLVKTIN